MSKGKEEPTPDTGAAIEFLRRWAPDGPWALTSIRTDKKLIETRTFHPTDNLAMRKWLDDRNGKMNLYFHVNPVMRDVNKKAEREDIKELAWLHVDVDPREREDLEEEHKRILALVTTNLPKGVPEPTCVIFSGGGYQAFWKLENPLPLGGDLSKAEDAKRYNQQLELLFGADNCHNIDRIMRLPGTINLPDARKLKKGRKPALAKVVFFYEGRLYPISAFTQAAPVQIKGDIGFGGASQETVRISGNVERIADINELDQWNVPDRVKVVIVQGHHPDEPKKGDNSRSAWLFDVLCQLVRAEVPDDVIYSIITDKDYGISESVLDKGSNSEKYALRQMARAKEEAIDPWLRRLNERHAVIGNMGGKCRVIEEVIDQALGRTRLTRQSFDDFSNRYMNQRIQVGFKEDKPVFAPVGKWWLFHAKRRQFETLVFAPGREIPGAYNLWKGFAFEQRPGDWSLFDKHLLENVCAGNRGYYDYLLNWMARAVQQPASPGEVAIVLRGGRGTGKGKTAKVFGRLFGRHFLHIANSSHLVGNFNSHLRDCVVLFADEAFYAGDKRHRSILNTLITEETITIEAKGVDAESAPNYIHLIMSSNDQHVVPAGGDERRYFVLDVGEDHKQEASYFAAIDEQMENGGFQAFLHDLLIRDISKFQVRAVPQTAALHEQKLLSLNVEEEWWFQKLEDGQLLRGARADDDAWPDKVRKDALVDDYIDYTRRFNVSRRGNQTALGRFLGRVCPKLTTVQQAATWEEPAGQGFTRTMKGRAYFWVLPTLAEARAAWVRQYGPCDWHQPQQGELEVESVPF